MIEQTAGKIFLADQRGVFETPKLRRFSTFNFGDYSHPHKAPLGNLSVMNEESLAPTHRVVLDVEQASHILLIPVTGEVHFTCPHGKKSAVDVGQVLVATLPRDTTFQLANSYESEVITFLQIRVQATVPVTGVAIQTFDFELNAIKGNLAELVSYSSGNAVAKTEYPFSLHLGYLAGREEVTYAKQREDSLFFGFVVAGAFEVEGRLLHQNDGLALWDTAEVELEALSENALILVIEVSNA